MIIKHLYLLIITIFYFRTMHCQIAASQSGNYAIPSGQTIRMRCLPNDVSIDTSSISGRRSYVWTDEEGRELVNPRMSTLETGVLQIMHTHEEDSGVYHCKFRPRKALEHDGSKSKIFEHKLIVYELPGHKFETTVTFDVTKSGSEATITQLRSLLKKKICATNICIPGPVTTQNCEINDMEKQMCEISMTYVAREPAITATCNETCGRQIMIDGLKKAQEALESSLLAYYEQTTSRIKPDLKTFDTKHVMTCKAGYRVVELNYEHCFPCLPGTYSEAGALECENCPIGFYQEKYGSHECVQCSDNLTTKTAGSKSRDDCQKVEIGIFKDIREGIAALFKG